MIDLARQITFNLVAPQVWESTYIIFLPQFLTNLLSPTSCSRMVIKELSECNLHERRPSSSQNQLSRRKRGHFHVPGNQPFKTVWLLHLCYVQKNSVGSLARWVMRLTPSTFEVRYRGGHENVVADYLSRHPLIQCEEPTAFVQPHFSFFHKWI